MKALKFIRVALFTVLICVNFASCNNESETFEDSELNDETLLDVNNYHFYFLIDGKKYFPNDTLYINDGINDKYHIEICNDEKELIYGFIDKQATGSVEIVYDYNYNTGAHYELGINDVGNGGIFFTMGKSGIYGHYISDGAGNIYPKTKNGKDIILNVVVKPLVDIENIVKNNMRLLLEKQSTGSTSDLGTYIKLIAERELNPYALKRFKIKEYGIPNYPIGNSGYWKNFDGVYGSDEKYVYFLAKLSSSTSNTIEEYYITFTYAGKDYTLLRTNSSEDIIWSIK